MWKRHQFVKPYAVGVCLLWLGLVIYVDITYQRHVSDYIRDQLDAYSCTVTKEEPSNTHSCRHIDSRNTYYSYSQGDVFTKHVNCTLGGANFYYAPSLLDGAADDYYLQFFLQILGPIILSYFFVELMTLVFVARTVLSSTNFSTKRNWAYLGIVCHISLLSMFLCCIWHSHPSKQFI